MGVGAAAMDLDGDGGAWCGGSETEAETVGVVFIWIGAICFLPLDGI